MQNISTYTNQVHMTHPKYSSMLTSMSLSTINLHPVCSWLQIDWPCRSVTAGPHCIYTQFQLTHLFPCILASAGEFRCWGCWSLGHRYLRRLLLGPTSCCCCCQGSCWDSGGFKGVGVLSRLFALWSITGARAVPFTLALLVRVQLDFRLTACTQEPQTTLDNWHRRSSPHFKRQLKLLCNYNKCSYCCDTRQSYQCFCVDVVLFLIHITKCNNGTWKQLANGTVGQGSDFGCISANANTVIYIIIP